MLLIFDIDLTICDNSMRKRKAVERALGRELNDREAELLLRNLAEDAIRMLKIDDETNKKVLEHFFYDEDLFELDMPMNGAVETLRALAENNKIYYVTGRPLSSTAVAFLKRNKFPDGEVLSVMVRHGESYKKTALFREILRKEGSSFAVAIGDLYGDAEAAKSAGIHAVGTVQAPEKAKYRKVLEKVCDAVIGDIRELPRVIEKLRESC